MTLEEAKAEYPDFRAFQKDMFLRCTANDWYCTGLCDVLEKATRIPFENIQKAIARHEDDIVKTVRYIKQRKER